MSSSSTHPSVIRICFYGAGSTTGWGNTAFKLIFSNVQPQPAFFEQQDIDGALSYLLGKIDKNGDHVITQDELKNLIIKVYGYSWGGITSIDFSIAISKADIITFGGKRNPIRYKLKVPIPINTLLTIDPVKFLNPAKGPVPNTVGTYYNFFQTKGGNGLFRKYPPANPNAPVVQRVGSITSRLLKGSPMTSNAGQNLQHNVYTQSPYKLDYTYSQSKGVALFGQDCNHDVIPQFTALYRNDFL